MKKILTMALAVAALHVAPADSSPPKWHGLDLRGAALATSSLAAVLYATSQAGSAGWVSAQTLGLGLAGAVGLAGFAALESRTDQPLLRVQRLADRAVGGGFLMMLIASAVLFGMFLLSSLFLQNVLGTGPLETVGKLIETIGQQGPDKVSPRLFPNSVMNAAAGHTCLSFKIKGPLSTLAIGTASGLLGLGYAADLIRSGEADVMLAHESARLGLPVADPLRGGAAFARLLDSCLRA